jgi:hypothetical protein
MKEIITRAQNLFSSVILTTNHNKFNKDSYHLSYESGLYRQSDLVKLIRDTVIYFALTPQELAQIDAETLAKLQTRAWKRISNRPAAKKGDYGELLLFLILEVFYPARKVVTKVRLRSSLGDEIKGYDCAHFSIENDKICLWLGEAKFHQDFNTAIHKAIESLNDHISDKAIKDELTILESNNTEINDGDRQAIEDYLNSGISLDEMLFKIPVLITYDSKAIGNHKEICDEFSKELHSELDNKYSLIDGRNINLKKNMEVHFILVPLQTVKEIKEALEKIEAAHK